MKLINKFLAQGINGDIHGRIEIYQVGDNEYELMAFIGDQTWRVSETIIGEQVEKYLDTLEKHLQTRLQFLADEIPPRDLLGRLKQRGYYKPID